MDGSLPAQHDAEGKRDSAAIHVKLFKSLEQLPAGCDSLFEETGKLSPCLTRSWFEILERHEIEAGERLKAVLTETDEDGGSHPVALLIGRHRDRDPMAYGGRSFTSLDSLYSLLFAPLTSSGLKLDCLAPAISEICHGKPTYDVIRIQAMDPASPAFTACARYLQAEGFEVQTYRHFGIWYEPTSDASFATYLRARPSKLRHTIERKSQTLHSRGRAEFILRNSKEGLESSLSEYEHVYASSWKAREPKPGLIREFCNLLDDFGALRLGFLYLDDEPIAAQIWINWYGTATLYKLAHDKRFDRLSPGTLLTAKMIEGLIDAEKVREIDLGPGDDTYKRDWASRQRERWGILAFNPRSLRGRMGIARHIWGRAVKDFVLGRTLRGPGVRRA